MHNCKKLFAVFLFCCASFSLQTALAAPTILTFQNAVDLAFQYSPLLKEAQANITANRGQLTQAKRYPNPSINLSTENFAGSGQYKDFNSTENTLMLSQPFPLGNKRSVNQKTKRSLIKASQKALLTYTASLYTTLGERYVDALYAESWLATTSRLVQLSQEIVTSIEKKIDIGSGSPLDLTAAKLQLAQSLLTKNIAQQLVKTTREQLALLIGKEDVANMKISEQGLPHKLPDLKQLKKALRNGPQLQQQTAVIQTQRDRIELSRSNVWPDLTVSIGARHFAQTHDDAMILEMSIPLPFFDRNQGNIQTALAKYDVALAKQQQLTINMKSKLIRIYQQAQASQLEAERVKTKLLPQARQAVDLAKEGYSQGRYAYIALSNAQNNLLRVEQQYWQAHANFDKSLLKIRGLLGPYHHEEAR